MIFHEIYGYYYQAMVKLLNAAAEHPLTQQEIQKVISDIAYSESFININTNIISGKWPFIDSSGKSNLKHLPKLPITKLEQQWLKTIAQDPRAKLFDLDISAISDLENIEPMYLPEDIIYFDRYLDGDNYTDEKYIEHFKIIREAIISKHRVRVSYINGKGILRKGVINPIKIEYSDKEDKMRVLSPSKSGIKYTNISRIISCEILPDKYDDNLVLPERAQEKIVLIITDRKRSLERFLMHMAHHRKKVTPAEGDSYEVELYYDIEDKGDLLISLLSFGHYIKVVSPTSIRNELFQRIKQQIRLFDFSKGMGIMNQNTLIEIKGKYNTAICYVQQLEDAAAKQIERICNHEFSAESIIRIMPDVHAGKGCTIGTTMTIKDKVVPNLVGVDIGCGMYTVNLGHSELDLPRIDAAVHLVPSGMEVWDKKQKDFDLKSLKCYKFLKQINRLECSLGTLGGGNHFIEIDQDDNGTNYLIIHSGSRNLGKQIAEYYQQIAVELNIGKITYNEAYRKIIQEYKAVGRTEQIQPSLENLKNQYNARKTSIPEDLCYLYGTYFYDYLHDMEICQEYARQSRELMAKVIMETLNLKSEDSFHTIHNYIDTKEMILRKGAIAANNGQRVLIPLNMRDGSILAVGKGNPEWNSSAPHGAGRLMSRKQALNSISMDEFKSEMANVYTTSVCEATLDEAPMAYKDYNSIMDIIHDTVDNIKHLKPIYNFKATEIQNLHKNNKKN